ncbi:Ig-like domain-containing protein [Mycolicibacterium madagascariense]|nr:tandem-95 repeat protein [Mycolicibacterium madagascariense]MCV7011400.1 tandem-95 repeat protein [Mycolicibacterium madagascariense]
MKHSEFVGRIGALAVALGIGTAIAAPAGIAWANPDTTSDSSSANSQSGGASSSTAGGQTASEGTTAQTPGGTESAHGGATTGSSTGSSATTPATSSPTTGSPSTGSPSTGSASTVDVAPGVSVSSSGGAHTSKHRHASTTKQDNGSGRTADSDSPTAKTASTKPTTKVANSAVAQAPKTAAAAAPDTAPSAATTAVSVAATTVATTPVALTPVTAKPAPVTIATIVRRLVTPMISSLLTSLERGLADSPIGWMLLAAARREIGIPDTATAPTASVTTTAKSLAATAALNTAVNGTPTATAVISTTDPTTGVVKGQVVGSDPEGSAVSLTLTTKPTAGTLVFNASSGAFTYTPTTAQRIQAGVTGQPTTIAMTVTVSDGTTKAPVQLDIPISAIPLGVRTDVPGTSGGSAIAATNTRAYVTNRDAGTVTVIDTITGSVVGTFAAGTAPDGLAVKQDGTRLYVSSSTANTVTVIDTATGTVKATIAVTAPGDPTMSPTGTSVYVLNSGTASVTRISTATNKVAATYKLPPGSRATGIAASADNTKVYVTSDAGDGTTSVLVFSTSSSATAVKIGQLGGAATSLTVSPNNATVYVGSDAGTLTVIDAKTRAVVRTIAVGGVPSSVAVSRDASAVVVTDDTGRVAVFDAASGVLLHDVTTHPASGTAAQQVSAVSPDGTELYVTDPGGGTVRIVSLVPPNTPPSVGTPVSGTPGTATGAVTGSLGATDADGDHLTYTVTGAPSRGKVTVNADGTFTYTPTAAARHAAAQSGGATTDSFTVTVSDGRRGVVTTTVQVAISPTNKAPTATATVGTPNGATGVVTGSVKGSDADKDTVTYTPVSGPAKGTVTVTATGTFVYTPDAAARHAAMKPGATAADKQDSFTVAVDDGHGGVATVAVTVKIGPANAAPTGGNGTITQVDPRTGVVTGTLSATDADGDTLTYKASSPKKGTLVVNADGSFTYTPSIAARDAASAANAGAATQSEDIRITVTDGYGGTATFTLSAPITPYPPGNRPPGNGQNTVTSTSSALGTVTGVVSAVDPEGDPLTYTVTTGPTKGVLTLDATTGAYTYTPTVDARYTALATPGVDTDTFTVTVSDGLGGTMTQAVSVTIAPPSATAVDQRPTTVAINAPDFLLYTQAQLNTALDALQATGIDTIRVMIAWASVQPVQGWSLDWSAVDRVINTATARGITVLGVLNSTPYWAVTPGTLPVSGSPNDPAQFAKFAALVAARYKGKVASYEVWNEPNGWQYWQPGPDAKKYTALLKAAYTAIKGADPNALVVAGALGSVIDFGNFTENPVRFVTEMYAAGAAGYFDALSFHPYLYNNPFSTSGGNPESALSQVKRIYQLMVANGDGNKKIWATEYGQPASVVSEANQASFIGDFLRAWRNLPFAGPAFIHTLVDWNSSDPTEASFGIYHKDWTPKPAVAVIEQVLSENEAIEAAAAAAAQKV